MLRPISRRSFLALTGSAIVAPSLLLGKEVEVPPLLDHILLGCNDLQAGIVYVEQRTGVRAAFGGVHPGRGTQNALLSLGEKHYLEIIAPDPGQPDSKGELALTLKKFTGPLLVGWAAHPGELTSFAKKLKDAGIAFEGPTAGSRKRPDGRRLQWQTLSLKDDASGLLPFFIEWSADSPHPSVDAPKGCSLLSFEAVTPDPDALARVTRLLSLDLPVAKSEKPQLRVSITGPRGDISLTS
jgi:hypothetical protein